MLAQKKMLDATYYRVRNCLEAAVEYQRPGHDYYGTIIVMLNYLRVQYAF